MGSLYYTDLIDVLAAAGVECRVSDVNAGWETRARSSGGFAAPPLAVFWHHSASSTTPQNDLAYMIHNAPDKPIGNMLLDRDGIVWPVAAGASNCAGTGGPVTLSRGTIAQDNGNATAWQIEAANDGVGEQWPVAQIDAYFAVSNALNARFGNTPSDVITHALSDGYGWTSRKIDPAQAASVLGPWRPASVTTAGTWSQADIRAECERRAVVTVPPLPPIGEPEMFIIVANSDYPAAAERYVWNGVTMHLLEDETEASWYLLLFDAKYSLAEPFWMTTEQMSRYAES